MNTKDNVIMTDESRPILTHLRELRQRLIAAAAFIIVGVIVSFVFLCDPAIRFIEAPLISRNVPVIYTGVSDAFTLRLRISLILGIVLTSPIIFFIIWRFIKPALYENEIWRFRVLFVVGLILFIMGILFCYFAVYTLALDFFLIAGENVATPLFAMDKYLNFLLSFLIPFGVSFELPVVIYMLASHGVVDYRQLVSFRKYVLLIIVTASAILTPPDVISQLMLSVPLFLLYEAGILVARVFNPADRLLIRDSKKIT
ncbi:twin-arginine translocase subunit TatC [Butyrivibrio sp. AE3004]|uniref:twin-arginine translocase subunit TatC n=1 Tax=Butyrivibrio sp. AE3004 TaxID=1506994 RepID=UPI00068D0820|nr:twin-arginine translocase subunit TatC [Butyrivibrio sp. AE3004]